MERKKRHREKENESCERWIKKGRRESGAIVKGDVMAKKQNNKKARK